MLMLGARNSSESQLMKGMNFNRLYSNQRIHNQFQELIDDRNTNDSSLRLANYLLIQKEAEQNDILQKYKTDLQSLYHAKVDDVDFTVDGEKIKSDVNDWVKGSTNGLIETMLDSPPSADNRLILLNAIYFKGKWLRPFNKLFSGKMKFYNKGVNEIETDFMMKFGEDDVAFKNVQIGGENVQAVELPYANESISMIILLPEKRDGLQKMLSSDSFEGDVSSAVTEISDSAGKTKINLHIPKFKLETEYTLNPTLKQMGMTDVFDSSAADLSGISGTRNLFVSEVKHKAVVKVDEEGTEAAGVTSVAVALASARPAPIRDFAAEHPFMFLIRDMKARLILFVGKVEEL